MVYFKRGVQNSIFTSRNQLFCAVTHLIQYNLHSSARGFGVGVWGQNPLSGGLRPLKLKSFEPSEERGSWQIRHAVKYTPLADLSFLVGWLSHQNGWLTGLAVIFVLCM